MPENWQVLARWRRDGLGDAANDKTSHFPACHFRTGSSGSSPCLRNRNAAHREWRLDTDSRGTGWVGNGRRVAHGNRISGRCDGNTSLAVDVWTVGFGSGEGVDSGGERAMALDSLGVIEKADPSWPKLSLDYLGSPTASPGMRLGCLKPYGALLRQT